LSFNLIKKKKKMFIIFKNKYFFFFFFFDGNSKSEFSVQENIDCAYNKSRSGCEGGWMKYAFKYAQKYGAVPLRNDPYEGKYNSGD
jgi:hypothetical protein